MVVRRQPRLHPDAPPADDLEALPFVEGDQCLVARPGVHTQAGPPERAALRSRPIQDGGNKPPPRICRRSCDPVEIDMLAALVLTPDRFVLVGHREYADQCVAVHDAEESPRLDLRDDGFIREFGPEVGAEVALHPPGVGVRRTDCWEIRDCSGLDAHLSKCRGVVVLRPRTLSAEGRPHQPTITGATWHARVDVRLPLTRPRSYTAGAPRATAIASAAGRRDPPPPRQRPSPRQVVP